jgi:hypothetical protein
VRIPDNGLIHVRDLPFSGRCKFPTWPSDAAWEDKRYCGVPVNDASHYCDQHLRLMFQPTRPLPRLKFA